MITPQLIDGVRRVGKSYIVEEFAKNEYGILYLPLYMAPLL